MAEDSKIGIVLLAIFGIATVIGALVLLSGKGAGIPVGNRGGYRIILKPNRAISSDDYKTIEYSIYRGNVLVDSGSITDISACSSHVIMKGDVPVGTYKIVIRYKDTTTEQEFEVKPNTTVIVGVEYEITKPQISMDYLTVVAKDYPDRFGNTALYTGTDERIMGIVNCNVTSFPLTYGSNIARMNLFDVENHETEIIYSNVRFTQRTKLVTGVVLQEDEGHITFEVMVFDKGQPLTDCKIAVYKGETPIIEKDAVDLGDGMWGIREVIERTGDTYSVYVKNRLGTVIYTALGAIHLSGKITSVYLERTYRWR